MGQRNTRLTKGEKLWMNKCEMSSFKWDEFELLTMDVKHMHSVF